jgi:hypothetical protein
MYISGSLIHPKWCSDPWERHESERPRASCLSRRRAAPEEGTALMNGGLQSRGLFLGPSIFAPKDIKSRFD